MGRRVAMNYSRCKHWLYYPFWFPALAMISFFKILGQALTGSNRQFTNTKNKKQQLRVIVNMYGFRRWLP